MEHNVPKLFNIKIFKDRHHQGANKRALRIITTHDPRIMPKYFKDRGWQFLPAQRKEQH